MPPRIARFVELLLGLIAPSACPACHAGEPNPVFCTACGLPAPVGAGAIDGVPVLAAGEYAPPLSDAIRRFKFEGRSELARPLATLLVPKLRELGLCARDAWVPVPLHRARLVERGYNQAALLARALATRSGATFAPLLLERRRETDQQARLGRAARSENAFGAFALRRSFSGGRVVLVDDVVTTGATADAASRALLDAGAIRVTVLALARAE